VIDFKIENRDGCDVVVALDGSWCRPANSVESALWRKLANPEPGLDPSKCWACGVDIPRPPAEPQGALDSRTVAGSCPSCDGRTITGDWTCPRCGEQHRLVRVVKRTRPEVTIDPDEPQGAHGIDPLPTPHPIPDVQISQQALAVPTYDCGDGTCGLCWQCSKSPWPRIKQL
jgi:hypothetical protein